MLTNEYHLKFCEYNSYNFDDYKINDLFLVDKDKLNELKNKLLIYDNNKKIKLIYFTKPLGELFEHQYTDKAEKIQRKKIDDELYIINNIPIDIMIVNDVVSNSDKLWEWLLEQELGSDWLYS